MSRLCPWAWCGTNTPGADLCDLCALTAERDDAIHGRDLARLDTEREREAVRALTAERDRLREALREVRGQLSLGPDGDEARRIIDAALSRTEADG